MENPQNGEISTIILLFLKVYREISLDSFIGIQSTLKIINYLLSITSTPGFFAISNLNVPES